jgi:hypothetical protein
MQQHTNLQAVSLISGVIVIKLQLSLTALSHTVLGVQLNSFSNWTTDVRFTATE